MSLFSSPQDYILLSGKKSPGLCDIIGARREYEYLVKQANFITGARMTFQRLKLAEFEVRLRLYTEEDLTALETWRPLIDRSPASRSIVKTGTTTSEKQASALDIQHPLLTALDIKSVVVLSVSQLEFQPDAGYWTLSIKFLEYRSPEIKTSQAAVDGSDAAPTPKNDVEKQIADLTAQVTAQSAQAALKIKALTQ